MEAIRHIQTVKNGEIHLQLPEQFWGQEVEIIVLSTSVAILPPTSGKKSRKGSLKHYAQPALIVQEREAWLRSVGEQSE